ncbi:hypothetical protein P7K49_028653 [Saguinus oedipus]|uniref:Uncharacterized protein n=1 Tax=Saguinus oedipus TaxID=9490 RepID=A0ABQ9U5S9_SAGOE|nr:hypothetical protein P7K49_028653 [Saguinus oedipus]
MNAKRALVRVWTAVASKNGAGSGGAGSAGSRMSKRTALRPSAGGDRPHPRQSCSLGDLPELRGFCPANGTAPWIE